MKGWVYGFFSGFLGGNSRKIDRAKKQYIRILTERKTNLLLYSSRQFNNEELSGQWGRLMAEFYIVCNELKEWGYNEEQLGDFHNMNEKNIDTYIENMR